MKSDTTNSNYESDSLDLACSASRRKLLKWSAPTVAAVTLPAHGQMSPIDPPPPPPAGPMTCASSPVLVATAPSKCSGSNPVIGEILLNLQSDGVTDEAIDIQSISHDAGSNQTISILATSLPAQITTTQVVQIGWVGDASDPTNCMPVQNITISVAYSCGASEQSTIDFSLAEVIANA